jgi:PPOX class probable F420-dependent enzyme
MTQQQRLHRLYDRVRHPAAGDVIVASSAPARGFDGLLEHKYCLVITYRRDGTAVPTPVWFGVDGARLYFHTGVSAAKVKRIRANGRAAVAPCTARGEPLGPAVEYRARILDSEEDRRRAEQAIRSHYGIGRMLYMRLRSREPREAAYIEVSSGPETSEDTPA